MKYSFSVVRYVPDSYRGEFVNIAVIVGSQESGEWNVRQLDNPERARRFDRDGSLAAVWHYLDQVGQVLDAQVTESADMSTELDNDWLLSEWRRHRNTVQLSEPSVIVAEDVYEATRTVFDTFVLDLERRGRKTRSAAVSALRQAYNAFEFLPPRLVHERVRVELGRQTLAVDFAVANGHLAQLSHGWSFQSQDTAATVQRIKAWSWSLSDMRERGGTVHLGANNPSFNFSDEVSVGVAYVEPDSDAGKYARDESLEVFDHLEVAALPTERAIELAASAVAQLRIPIERRSGEI